MQGKIHSIKQAIFKIFSFLMLCALVIFGQGLLTQPAQASSRAIANDISHPSILHTPLYTLDANIPPAVVSPNPGQMDVFVVTTGGEVLHDTWFSTLGWYFGWESLGTLPGYHITSVSAISISPGHMDLYATAYNVGITSLSHIAHKYWSVSGGWGPSINGWDDLGSVNHATNYPLNVFSWGPSRIDIVGRYYNPNESGIHKWWDGNAGGYGPSATTWEYFGSINTPKYTSLLTAAPWGSGAFDVFRTSDNGNLYHRYYANGAWGPVGTWDNLGGEITFPVAVSLYPARMDVFGTGAIPGTGVTAGSTIYHKVWSSGAWSNWEALGGCDLIEGYTVAAAYLGAQHVELFESCSGGVYHKYWNGSSWVPSATGWTQIGSIYLSSPSKPVVLASGSSRLDVFTIVGSDLRHTYSPNSGASWGPWEVLTLP